MIYSGGNGSLHIKSLKLRNFRNYETLCLEFDKDYNIIYGDNAQGKTNIIESIFLCASGRSHRTPRDMELVRGDANGYYVKVELEKEDRDLSIELQYSREEKKRIRINEIPEKKIGSLMGQLNAVIFSPEDLFIVKEGPSERRRFLDITLSQLRPTYFYDLQQYAKVLSQRNMLLKEIDGRKDLLDTLEVWNRHLIKIGSRIIKARNEFIAKMSKRAEKRHERLTNEKELLCIEYEPSFPISNYESFEEIEAQFEKVLNTSLKKELSKCTTLYGPQRDDYEIILNGMSTKQYGSQGQQRTAVLSIKLSEIDIMKEETGEYPVLLLDDVMSELDLKRQEYLFGNIENIQTFITGTDGQFYRRESLKAKYFHVIKGEVFTG